VIHLKKVSINQILVWMAQAAVIGFMIPTVIGFFVNSNQLLTLEGSFFLMPIIMGLIGFSIIGEVAASIVMGITAVLFIIMLLNIIFFVRALKYGVFLFSILLLDVTTMFAWYKGEVFSVGYVTFSFIIHLLVMGLLVGGMMGAYRIRIENQITKIEKEELAEAEVEFEVEDKLIDPFPESKENTEDSVSSDS
jgi:hypothetical protein